MRWIKFADGSYYTLAVDIQKFAEKNGYTVPCETDGTRHPGTDCNTKMRTIVKDAGLRRTFGITEQSVVDVKRGDSVNNADFMQWLVDSELVSSSYLKLGVIQLYAHGAVDALLSSMLNTHVEYDIDDDDDVWYCGYFITRRSHNFEKKKNKPKVSLFKK